MFLDFCTVNPTNAKIKYATQITICPPTFAIFGSKMERLPKTYLRYLENCLRKEVDFTGTPVRIWLRENADKRGE